MEFSVYWKFGIVNVLWEKNWKNTLDYISFLVEMFEHSNRPKSWILSRNRLHVNEKFRIVNILCRIQELKKILSSSVATRTN